MCGVHTKQKAWNVDLSEGTEIEGSKRQARVWQRAAESNTDRARWTDG